MRSNVKNVVSFLATLPRDERGDAWANGQTIKDGTNLKNYEINDAIVIAESKRHVEIVTPPPNFKPWKFSSVTITALGRLWLEEEAKI